MKRLSGYHHRKGGKQTKKLVETLVRFLWRTAALRLPRARDCTGSSNNLVPRSAKLSAIDVTAQEIFGRVYLVPGPHQFAPFTTMPSAPTPPPLTEQLFLDFPVFSPSFFPGVAPQFFCQHDSPSNLALSRYPCVTPLLQPRFVTSISFRKCKLFTTTLLPTVHGPVGTPRYLIMEWGHDCPTF